jgi:carbon-monoxide dehydrogenase large subunit
MPSFRNTIYPPLATDRVRFVGQPIAMCLGATRAAAEDLADLVELDLAELPPVLDSLAAMQPGSPKLYDNWPDNAFIASTVAAGDVDAVIARAPIKIRRQFRMNRQSVASLENRAILAYHDRRLDELVVYLSTQGPHVMRMGLAETLGIPEHKLRVIAPDVGGGFGGKNRMMPEEVAVVALALQVDHPVRWIEDRRESLLAGAHAREHFYDLTLYAEADGTFLALDADVYINAGAYSLWPTGAFAEAAMAARNLPGPYRIQNLRARNWTVATNKAPLGPYRGVARPGACFAIERMVDEAAAELGIDPLELRRRNIVTSAELPYDTAGGMRLDTGDYIASLNACETLLDREAWRARQEKGEPDGRKIGIGFAFYTEQSGHGTAEWTRRKSRVVPGYETSTARMLPDGTMQLLVGIQSHGQGMETTLAQIAAHELGMDPKDISVRHGDTGISPFGFGTFASRSIVMGGGAVAKSSRLLADRLRAIGAHLLQCPFDQTTLRDSQVYGGSTLGSSGNVSFAEISRAAHVRPDLLPEGTAPVLESTATYEPSESGGAFSYATHAAVIAVDHLTGATELLDYAVAEDCGTMINPMVVDGQVMGGVVQGIGTALFEEIPYDPQGQPLATTFADYHMPCASELPDIRVHHLITPALFTEYGIKGVGEGGAIAPPAAIANALTDAFRAIGARFNETPCTPRRILAALDEATSR